MSKTTYYGIASVIMVLGLLVLPLIQYQADAVMQKLTKTNLPVTLPLTRGYVNGFEVFYISTEASDKNVADDLTKLTGARVAYTPALKRAPAESLANIYVFTNGIEGSGPAGFQPNVADSQPGDPRYSPLWKLNMVQWNENVTPRELKSEDDILKARNNNELTITSTDVIVNCPFVKWNGGQLEVRTDKVLSDETAYGGGQVLNIDIARMTVTFVAHRGFAPDGRTIYYIATDASVKEVADDLGVIFVEKTGTTLTTAAASDLFVFTNGIEGTGPMGFQASIASTNVGDDFYSPLWRIQAATWKDASEAQFLETQAAITAAGATGKLTTDIAGVVVNCPFVEVKDAMTDKMMDKMMGKKEYVSMRGDLTVPEGDKPFGGDAVGTYLVKTKGQTVRIIAKLDRSMSDDKVLEGWLVDVQSGYKLSTGQLGARNTLVFTQTLVNPSIYDLIVITEELIGDADPSPDKPVAGAQLGEPFGK